MSYYRSPIFAIPPSMTYFIQTSLAPFLNFTKIKPDDSILRTRSSNVVRITNSIHNHNPRFLESLFRKTKPMHKMRFEGNRRDLWRVNGSDDGSCGIVPQWSPPPSVIDSIKNFYEAINNKKRDQLEGMLLDNSVYKDLIFYVPFEGKEDILNFLENLMDAMGPNVNFVIDNIAEGDNYTTLVIWHLEWKNKELPFSSGCCFFECTEIGDKQYIKKIRGVEELPVKPGDLVLKLLKAMTNFFDRFPIAAEGILLKSRDGSHEGIQLIIDMLGLGKH